ncbi:hypothetical protein HYFRA_00003523 [Hymenoscyphus fraxineus]|uniref:Uncharacterized protein n=1 Tax=Hymenoscyphus fraxineus TaxID=746836 RepID=A0A9N9PRP3_9HELO|nr:hypothetical protein HYFRA_00003523 [Hymenoscyphus fraxineus]
MSKTDTERPTPHGHHQSFHKAEIGNQFLDSESKSEALKARRTDTLKNHRKSSFNAIMAIQDILIWHYSNKQNFAERDLPRVARLERRTRKAIPTLGFPAITGGSDRKGILLEDYMHSSLSQRAQPSPPRTPRTPRTPRISRRAGEEISTPPHWPQRRPRWRNITARAKGTERRMFLQPFTVLAYYRISVSVSKALTLVNPSGDGPFQASGPTSTVSVALPEHITGKFEDFSGAGGGYSEEWTGEKALRKTSIASLSRHSPVCFHTCVESKPVFSRKPLNKSSLAKTPTADPAPTVLVADAPFYVGVEILTAQSSMIGFYN